LKAIYTSQVEKTYGEILLKIKKGSLTKEERLQPKIPEILQQEILLIDTWNLDNN